MTVSVETIESGPFSALSASFTFSFRILDEDHLVVTHTSLTEVDTVLTIGDDYTVSGVGDATGTVTLTASGTATYAVSGETIKMERVIPNLQLSDLSGQASFDPQVHEDALDKLTMLIQKMQERLNRTIAIPDKVGGWPSETLQTLSDASGRADTFLGFDSLGVPVTNASIVLPSDTADAWVVTNIFSLSDLAGLKTLLTLGTAAYLDTGSSTGEVVALEDVGGSPGMPAVDGSQLTNITSSSSVPTGMIMAMAGGGTPVGYLLCDGAAVNKTTYLDLWNVIGYLYGGAGAVFNLPDFRGRGLVGMDDYGSAAGDASRLAGTTFASGNRTTLGATCGADTHTITSATQLPAHGHGATGLTATPSLTGAAHVHEVLTVNSAGSDDGLAFSSSLGDTFPNNYVNNGNVDTGSAGGGAVTGTITMGGTTANTGASAAIESMPPSQLVWWVIKT